MKNKKVLSLIGILIFAFSLSAVTAEDIVKKINTKYNGSENKIQNMYMEQSVTVFNEKEEIATEMKMWKKNDKFRMEVGMPVTEETKGMDMTTVIMFDGQDYWTVIPFIGKQKMADKDAKQYQKEENWKWWEEAKNWEYVGDEEVAGCGCYVLQKKEESETVAKYWINKMELYIMKMETIDGKDAMTTIMSDFKDVKGYKMPYKYEVSQKDKLISRMVVKTLTLNGEINDDLFNPEKLKGSENIGDMFKGFIK